MTAWENSTETLNPKTSQTWWCMLVIPATQEAEVGELWSKDGPGESVRACLENKLKQKG
jgi:hypothetical protein